MMKEYCKMPRHSQKTFGKVWGQNHTANSVNRERFGAVGQGYATQPNINAHELFFGASEDRHRLCK